MTEKIKVVIADDHTLFRKGMVNLMSDFSNCTILYETNNGEELIQQFSTKPLPDIVILDINMPLLDGYQTALWIRKNYPKVKILALTMNDSEESIIKMFQAGANGYILKDSDPAELQLALNELMKKDFYHSEMVTGALLHNMNNKKEVASKHDTFIKLNDRELEFLKLTCTELTYKEIADKMFIAPRTADRYREVLFEKLDVKNRVGLVIYAIKNKIVSVN
jgi:two-component system, NarL family, invasion response regulator UvrY